MNRLAFATSLLGALGACSDSSVGPDSGLCTTAVEGDVAIAALVPVTGVFPVGEGLERGARLAVDEINDAGGLTGGRRLGLIACDTGGEPSLGAALVDEHAGRVAGIVGPGRSAVMLGDDSSSGVAEAALRHRVVVVSPAATSPAIGDIDDDDFLYRTVVSDAVQGQVLASLASAYGLERVFVLQASGDPYTLGVREQFMAAFEATAGADSVTYAEFDADTDADELLGVVDEGGYDAVLVASFAESAVPVLQAASNFEWVNPPRAWLAPDGMRTPVALTPLAELGDNGALIIGTNPSDPRGPAFGAFASAHRQAFETAPAPFAAQAYDAVYLLAAAVSIAGDPLIGDDVRDAMMVTQPGAGTGVYGPGQWVEMRGALQRTGGYDYHGAGGVQDFDASGDVEGNIDEWAVEDGVFVFKRCWTPAGDRCD